MGLPEPLLFYMYMYSVYFSSYTVVFTVTVTDFTDENCFLALGRIRDELLGMS